MVRNSYYDVDMEKVNAAADAYGKGDINGAMEGLQAAVEASGGKVMAIGGGNTVDGAYYSQLMGVDNKLTGKGEYTSDDATKLDYLEGFHNIGENIQNSYMIGSYNTIKNGKHNIVYGDNQSMDGVNNNIVIGSADSEQTLSASGAVQIGHNAKVEKDGGVAIGEGSVASKEAPATVGYGATAGNTGAAWKATAAAVSVGDTKVTRQIANVAAGSDDTDAVNVAQLKNVAKAADAAKSHYYSVNNTLDLFGKNLNYENDGAHGASSLSAGINTMANGIMSSVTGSNSIIADLNNLEYNAPYGLRGSASAVYGSFNVVQLDTSNLQNEYDGVANSLVGQANMTQNANAAIILGAGNTITNSYRPVQGIDSSLITGGINANKIFNALKDAVPESGGQVMAIGGGNSADYAQQSQLMGVGNELKGTEAEVSKLNYLEGFYNKAENVQNAYIIGANNTVKNGKNNIVLGDKRTMDKQNGNIIIGSGEGDDGTATTVSNALILGNKANATVDGGIAIGEGSIASTKAGAIGYDPSGKANKTGGAWVATNAAVAVGNGDTLTRQITGVAAGTNDTDAVNVAQLKQVKDAIDAKVDTNTTYTLSSTTAEKDGATETTISLTDDQKKDAGSVTVRNDTLAKDQNNALTLNGNTLSLSIKDTAGNEAKGSVNLSSFKSAVDTRNTVAAGDHISLKEDAQADGSTKYTVSVKTDGKVASGDTGIVTGGTVYNETRTASDGFVTKTTATAGENILALDKQVETNKNQIATNTTNIANNTEAINNINQNVENMGHSINKLDSKINKVGAGAAALAALHPQDFNEDDKWDFAAGFGNYRDANAVAVGAFYRPDHKTMFSVGGSFGNGENMVNMGVSLKFGKSSPYTGMSKAALVNTIEDLKAKDAKRDEVISQQQKEIEELKAAVAKLMAAK